MPNRRQFLFTTVAVCSAPWRAIANAGPSYRDTFVVGELLGTHARQFTQSSAGRSALHGHDPVAMLAQLNDQLRGGRINWIVGLTAESTRFLIEQSAAEHGFRILASAVHDMRKGSVTHSLTGPKRLLHRFERGVRQDARAWPAYLASGFRACIASNENRTGKQQRQLVELSDEHLRLASFCLTRVAA